MELVCGKGNANLFEQVGRGLVHLLELEGMIGADIDFLDVGCGCGRIARYLLPSRIRSYSGFDRHPGMIDWCERELGARDARFTFQHFDLKSVYVSNDGYAGTLSAAQFEFPYAAKSYDSVLLASVFTHMPLDETSHYLRELHRVVRPAAKILLSVFFSETTPYVETTNFFYRPRDFIEQAERAGFHITHREPPPKFGYTHNWHVLMPKT
jgi:SAM-dependent methyltransferase